MGELGGLENGKAGLRCFMYISVESIGIVVDRVSSEWSDVLME